ncbi:copper resistance protein CopC [Micromonospora sp. NPDC023966]|uniref:copper resistance CopC family protein n=1 Tax=Micromonospora sp. NPDC023966 TaxID=3154699 RepID=UPI0033D8BBB0
MRTAQRSRQVGSLVLAILVSAIALQLVGAGEAAAHTRLVSSSPHMNAKLEHLPEAVKLTFSEAVAQPVALTVTGPDGSIRSTGKVSLRKASLSRPLATTGEAPAGRYTISYQVTSTDGHPLSGTVRFTLAPGVGTGTNEPPIGGDAANANLASSLPDNGSEVGRLPEVAVLNFNEVIAQPAEVRVTGPNGVEVCTDDISIVDATLLCPLDATVGPAAGTYTMSYQARSSKGQRLAGTVRFTLSPSPVIPATDVVTPAAGRDAEQSHPPLATVVLVIGLVAALGVALLDVKRLVRNGFLG